LDKRVANLTEAVAGIPEGAVVLVGGFGNSGEPEELLTALAEVGAKDLTLVSNNAGSSEWGIGKLMMSGAVRKIICSFPRVQGSTAFEELYDAGKLELELVPQGTIAERVRAAGAGIPGFYTRTSYGTPLGEGKEVREFNGVPHVFEEAIYGDVAVVKAEKGDPWGNLTYAKSSRNFNPVMAMGAKLTIAQVRELVDLGDLDPENVITPGIFVDRVVQVEA
jgi:3-oxoadipate CoA-transferase alpha subunit